MPFPKIRLPSLSVRPLLNKGPPLSLQVGRNPGSKTPLNLDLQSRSRNEADLAVETFVDNEARASNPTGNPTWIMREPSQGKDKALQG